MFEDLQNNLTIFKHPQYEEKLDEIISRLKICTVSEVFQGLLKRKKIRYVSYHYHPISIISFIIVTYFVCEQNFEVS